VQILMIHIEKKNTPACLPCTCLY